MKSRKVTTAEYCEIFLTTIFYACVAINPPWRAITKIFFDEIVSNILLLLILSLHLFDYSQ